MVKNVGNEACLVLRPQGLTSREMNKIINIFKTFYYGEMSKMWFN